MFVMSRGDEEVSLFVPEWKLMLGVNSNLVLVTDQEPGIWNRYK